jgi:hypothetical protein
LKIALCISHPARPASSSSAAPDFGSSRIGASVSDQTRAPECASSTWNVAREESAPESTSAVTT